MRMFAGAVVVFAGTVALAAGTIAHGISGPRTGPPDDYVSTPAGVITCITGLTLVLFEARAAHLRERRGETARPENRQSPS
jgi:hypothetical protein